MSTGGLNQRDVSTCIVVEQQHKVSNDLCHGPIYDPDSRQMLLPHGGDEMWPWDYLVAFREMEG